MEVKDSENEGRIGVGQKLSDGEGERAEQVQHAECGNADRIVFLYDIFVQSTLRTSHRPPPTTVPSSPSPDLFTGPAFSASRGRKLNNSFLHMLISKSLSNHLLSAYNNRTPCVQSGHNEVHSAILDKSNSVRSHLNNDIVKL